MLLTSLERRWVNLTDVDVIGCPATAAVYCCRVDVIRGICSGALNVYRQRTIAVKISTWW